MPVFDRLTQPLESLRLRYLSSPVPGWLRSAGEAMLSLLPGRWRRQLGAQRRRLLLHRDADQLCLEAMVEDQVAAIGALPLSETESLALLQKRLDETAQAVPRWLLLDASQVLRRELVLPASAEPRLREILSYEIDRQTPFSADQVSFEARVLAREAASRQLRVELIAVPKAVLEAAQLALGPLASGLSGADVRDSKGQCLGVNLLPATQRSALAGRARHLNVWLSAAALLAIFMAMMLMLQNRQETLKAFQTRMETANGQARQVRKLRDTLGTSARAANFLAKRRAEQPTILEILNDLTHRIPDDTSLEKLSIGEGEVTLVGQSQQAPALVALLQASPLLRTPALSGAVRADPRSGRDRFTLTAMVAGASEEDTDGKVRRNP